MSPFWYIRSVVLPFVCVVTLLVLINYGSVCGIIQINAAGFNSRIAFGGGLVSVVFACFSFCCFQCASWCLFYVGLFLAAVLF